VFPLGHVGIGTHLIPRKLRERLPWRWLALGCLLPDVIDKPIWIVAEWLGAQSAHFDTARMFGHTAFLCIAVAIAARFLRSPPLVALAYGIPTHLVLDILTDKGMGGGWGVWKSWLFWPFEIPDLGILMVTAPLHEFSSEIRSPIYLAGEVVGAALLVWDAVQKRMKRH
jgi:LexA-binding, inner membrane-associated putative hydrolase